MDVFEFPFLLRGKEIIKNLASFFGFSKATFKKLELA